MDLKTYLKSLADEQQRENFARRCGTSFGHLRNIGYGYKPCATDLAVRIERESRSAVTRRDLRSDWAEHWPELVETKRAPSVPSKAEQGAAPAAAVGG